VQYHLKLHAKWVSESRDAEVELKKKAKQMRRVIVLYLENILSSLGPYYIFTYFCNNKRV
jgi:hypothetical protein